jgi:hypothetical protein
MLCLTCLKAMAGALGFEPRNFLIQSQAPYQLGHAPAVRLRLGQSIKGSAEIQHGQTHDD